MKRLKKSTTMIVTLVITLCSFAGCGNNNTQPPLNSPLPTPTETEAPVATMEEDSNIDRPAEEASDFHWEFTYFKDSIYVDTFGKRRYASIAEITNVGTEPFFFRSTDYELTDTNGEVIQTGKYDAYPYTLYPGEKGYYFSVVDIDEGIDEVILNPKFRFMEPVNPRVDFETHSVVIEDGEHSIEVRGMVKTNSEDVHSTIMVPIIFFTEDGAPFGIWLASVQGPIEADSEREFVAKDQGGRVLYDGLLTSVTADMVSSYVVYAYH